MKPSLLKNKTIQIFCLWALTAIAINAGDLNERYSIEYGILGEVANVSASLKSDKKHYILDANVTITGSIAKMITRHLKERHISKGHIKDGRLISDSYQMIKSYGKYKSTTLYETHHKRKKVTKAFKLWKNGKKVVDEFRTLGYYGANDMMTLFLNLNKQIKKKNLPKHYRYKVVGADRMNGLVDVIVPSKKELKKILPLLGEEKNSWYSKVIMHRKLYNSKQGELAVKIGKEAILDKAVLKDLIFFGDVRIIRERADPHR